MENLVLKIILKSLLALYWVYQIIMKIIIKKKFGAPADLTSPLH